MTALASHESDARAAVYQWLEEVADVTVAVACVAPLVEHLKGTIFEDAAGCAEYTRGFLALARLCGLDCVIVGAELCRDRRWHASVNGNALRAAFAPSKPAELTLEDLVRASIH